MDISGTDGSAVRYHPAISSATAPAPQKAASRAHPAHRVPRDRRHRDRPDFAVSFMAARSFGAFAAAADHLDAARGFAGTFHVPIMFSGDYGSRSQPAPKRR
ncbi:hypothetical protein [Methylobacterium sp. sgz302541]|uniref:hypothetical protein n=1 Tax=unclassified Methylobacterium TaxID=2615210 RepID=UPI003D333C9F